MGDEKERKSGDGVLLTLEKIFRLCSVLVWWAFSVPALYLLVPLRLLSPLLRAWKVPSGYLPLDVIGRFQVCSFSFSFSFFFLFLFFFCFIYFFIFFFF